MASLDPAVPPGFDLARVDALRSEAADLLRAQSEDGWRSWAHGDPSHQAELYSQHPQLFTRQHIEVARALAAQSGAPHLRLFQLHLEREFAGQQIAPLHDEIANREAAAEVAVDGRPMPFRQLAVALANEGAALVRERLFRAADPVYETLNPLRLRAEHIFGAVARQLGYADYIEFAETQRAARLLDLRGTCRRLLSHSRALYERLLDAELAAELRLPRDSFFRYDTSRLLRSTSYDHFFTREQALPALRATLGGLGIELDAQTNIRLDLDDRPKKVPRAVMFNVDAPADIRISVKPLGGIDDFAALFHEMGHAQHFANTTEREWEFRNVGGSNAVTEVFAFHLEHVLDDPEWLGAHTSMSAAERARFSRSRAFRRLFMVRRYCAKLEYELELHAVVTGSRESRTAMPARYAQLLARALLYQPHPSEPARYLADVDDLFYSADYLRAWFLEAQITARLRREFGGRWFEARAAGDYLKSLWSVGQRFSADEFVAHFALEPISPAALLAEIEALAGAN